MMELHEGMEISEADWLLFRKQKKDEAIEVLKTCDDPEDALVWIGNHEYLNFLIENFGIFFSRGFYEKGLFLALTMANLQEVHTKYSSNVLLFLLEQADIEKLRSYGDSFTFDQPVEVFRGIPDSKNTRSIRRPSWTLKPETAAWFAAVCGRSYGRPDKTPAVYRMMAPPEAIYFYTNERGEDEIVLNPRHCGPAKRLPALPTPIQPKSQEDEDK